MRPRSGAATVLCQRAHEGRARCASPAASRVGTLFLRRQQAREPQALARVHGAAARHARARRRRRARARRARQEPAAGGRRCASRGVRHRRPGRCVDAHGREFARGLASYSADEVVRIQGLATRTILAVLGFSNGDEVIHRDDLSCCPREPNSSLPREAHDAPARDRRDREPREALRRPRSRTSTRAPRTPGCCAAPKRLEAAKRTHPRRESRGHARGRGEGRRRADGEAARSRERQVGATCSPACARSRAARSGRRDRREMRVRPNGLRVGRMRIPLGVIGIIYESRPNVTVDAAALCVKAGNAVILRGGSRGDPQRTSRWPRSCARPRRDRRARGRRIDRRDRHRPRGDRPPAQARPATST